MFRQLVLLFLMTALIGDSGRALASGYSKPSLTEYQILRKIPRARLRALIGNSIPDKDGFVGTNARAGQWVEAGTQRGSCRTVIYGVVADDLAMADDAWRGVEAAFSRQLEDGRFEANVRPNGASAKPFGAAVETSYFFLQEVGRMVLIIRESPHESHFRSRLAVLEPKIRRGMAFVDSGYETIIEKSTHSVNRIVIAAKAFGLCGLVLKDQHLIATSRRLVAHALKQRDDEGVFIEKGGRDSSYNVVSILFGQCLALYLPIPEFEAALPKAVAWQLTKVRENGQVDVTGNTRTGVGKEISYFGDPKVVNYGEVVQALTLYGLVKGDKAALAAAERAFEYWKSDRQ